MHSLNEERAKRGMAGRPLDDGGGPPHNGDMEARVSKLEQDISQVKDKLNTVSTDVAVIKSNYATKADVAEAKNSIIMWVVSAVLLAQVLPMILKKFGL
ncbi:hypothetical protein [Chromobacterium violaceum]|uniref:hypothetical protein n=1 Tax=Chromobacterium violaceum TaxID=536 RepID=UPI00143DD631|nr:hypothetical protein [Chromobacterium violaceum]QIY81481.1 hypothetical protein FOB43_20935 [Chromobacterium violaceum]